MQSTVLDLFHDLFRGRPEFNGQNLAVEIRRHDTYCSNSSCSPSTRFAGLGPGDRRAIGRPSKRSSAVTNSAVPSGRPLPSDRRSAAKSSARSCKSRSAKHDIRSSTGRTITRLSSTPARWARALDQGQSSARDTRRARTGRFVVRRCLVRRDWDFARTGEPATTFNSQLPQPLPDRIRSHS